MFLTILTNAAFRYSGLTLQPFNLTTAHSPMTGCAEHCRVLFFWPWTHTFSGNGPDPCLVSLSTALHVLLMPVKCQPWKAVIVGRVKESVLIFSLLLSERVRLFGWSTAPHNHVAVKSRLLEKNLTVLGHIQSGLVIGKLCQKNETPLLFWFCWS